MKLFNRNVHNLSEGVDAQLLLKIVTPQGPAMAAAADVVAEVAKLSVLLLPSRSALLLRNRSALLLRSRSTLNFATSDTPATTSTTIASPCVVIISGNN